MGKRRNMFRTKEILLTLSVVLLLTGCKQKQKASIQAVPPTPPSVQQVEAPLKNSLGGGYKGIKWGVTRKEVVQGLKMNPASAKNDELVFKYDYFDEKKERCKTLICKFYENRFYEAVFNPGLPEDDTEGVKAILVSLLDKYGSTNPVGGYEETTGIQNVTYTCRKWEDGETRIVMRIYTPDQYYFKSILSWTSLGLFPSNSLSVTYTSMSIINELENKKMNVKMQPYKNDF